MVRPPWKATCPERAGTPVLALILSRSARRLTVVRSAPHSQVLQYLPPISDHSVEGGNRTHVGDLGYVRESSSGRVSLGHPRIVVSDVTAQVAS